MMSTEPTATPRVATRRVSRFSPRPTYGSPLLGVPRNVERPPLVLEWGSSFLRVGYAEQAQLQHVLPLPSPLLQATAAGKRTTAEDEEESHWYNLVSPLVQHLYDRLMMDPSQRRVVCVTRAFPVRAWEEALKEALWNLGVPAVTFLNSLEVVPVALGWKRGMVIHVGRDEAQCLAHVDGHPLPFTYQAVPSGYAIGVEDPNKIQTQWSVTMDRAWLDDCNPNSLVVAVLKCLEACPRDTRKDVVHNLLVCGDTALLVPDLGRRVALKLKQVLLQQQSSSSESSPPPIQEKVSAHVLNYVPVSIAPLRSLADHVGVISCAPHRPDRISWVGASVFATIWHRQDEQNARVPWLFSPTAKASE